MTGNLAVRGSFPVMVKKAHDILTLYQPGVRGAFSSLNSFIYCGAGVNGKCAAGVPNTIRNGFESMDIVRITNKVA